MPFKQRLSFVKPGSSESVFTEEKGQLLDDGRGCVVTWNADHKLSIEAQRQRLPVFHQRLQFLYLIENYSVVIVVGETGSGKSTQLPQYLYEAGWTEPKNKQVGCVAITQPRRVAAVTLAARVAEEKGWQLGKECGYAVRFEDCQSPQETHVKYLTDGMLIREMMRDPLLTHYRVVMVDEAHERSLQSDLLLGLLKKIQRRRPELRLVVASATIDAEEFREYFRREVDTETNTAGCSVSVLSVEGRQFPVEVHYLVDPAACYLKAARRAVLLLHKQEPSGDVLVFLTGQEEVCQMVRDLSEEAQKLEKRKHTMKMKVLPMYGALPHASQLKVFDRLPKHIRKVVVATNIAETSVTIPGIAYVIDCGFTKLRALNTETGLERLLVTRTSRASARQRAGRAGRLRAGRVYRLYTQKAAEELPIHTPPEMTRCELSRVLLQLKALGVDNFVRFEFLSPPSAQNVSRAAELLHALGALDSAARLTAPLGLRMAELPLHPLAARMLLAAGEPDASCVQEAAAVAALMQIQHIFLTPTGQRRQARAEQRKFCCAEGDHLSQLNALLAFERRGCKRAWCQQNFLHYRGLVRCVQLRDQLIRAVERLRIPVRSARGDTDTVRRTIVRGYFAQAARLHPSGEYYLSVRGNRALHLHPGSVLYGELPWPKWVVFTDLVETDKEYMEAVTVIEPEWLYQLAPHYYQYGSDRELHEKRLKTE